ncbi:YlxQ family RNA-binding protein [Fervidibacillus halotolerans]|uniref:YlxQ family RNA-binding protein n=1 Tax=Fervidibacillus halotolerans TaxID=2980027 RepID=A0A9E8M261_9BACI|nr:YlxQ family RNA-binding protein [Fervidibacillus halotolerans]WAA13565.1 YlxQ family RNA-binding protein [Fervidibacillus halotolerans]
MVQEKWLSLLGLANRAGKIVTGEELVLKEIQKKRAKLVILTEDVSNLTSKRIKDKCSYYGIPVKQKGNRQMIGAAIGKHARVVVAVTDEGFSKKLLTLLD